MFLTVNKCSCFENKWITRKKEEEEEEEEEEESKEWVPISTIDQSMAIIIFQLKNKQTNTQM